MILRSLGMMSGGGLPHANWKVATFKFLYFL